MATTTTDDRTSDDESGEIVSLQEFLEQENAKEEDATAVLGASDDANCTYNLGYVKRQALFSCLTCTPRPESAGVCLACSLHCHEGHEVIELYTKRNFCCDCGNTKFSGFVCKLVPEKQPVNTDNRYNHNFHGTYCECRRPYPDPDSDVDDEMIQCICCEDWYHSRHLNAIMPSNYEFSELVCSKCVERLPFLLKYATLEPAETNGTDANCSSASADEEPTAPTVESESEDVTKTATNERTTTCLLKCLVSPATSAKGAVFLSDDWRMRLCQCQDCMDMYKEADCTFLIDSADTVHHYEEMGKTANESADGGVVERGMRAFSKAYDRTTQIEMAHGYNDLKVELVDYLKNFAANGGKVVREENIREFFDVLSRKRRRIE